MSRTNSDKHVLVAMSGGVDSSVALYLLKQQGFTVSGATMKLWDYSEVGGREQVRADSGCCDLNSINNARTVCENLGVGHYVINFSKEFKNTVIENFVSEYSKGRTPNPCVLCNTEIKWEMFLRYARQIGCDYIATGHYASTGFDDEEKRSFLRRGIDGTRDQAYALWGISQEALTQTILPLGDIKKKEVREIAEKAGLKTAHVAESMEICFIADNNYERFIREWTDVKIPDGDIVDEKGRKLGRHKGVPFYTVGQRKGLGISNPTPLYVNKIDADNNLIVVGDKKAVHSNEFTVSRVNWVSKSPTKEPFTGLTQIRYQHTARPSQIIPEANSRLRIIFDSPQPAVTPGQSAVIFDEDTVLVGGIID